MMPLPFPEFVAGIIAVFLLLIAVALTSGALVALFAITPAIREKLETQSSRKGKMLVRILSDSAQLRGTLLVANNVFKFVLVVAIIYLIHSVFLIGSLSIGALIFLALLAMLVLIFPGIVIPKLYARNNTGKYTLFIVGWVQAVQKVFSPVSNLYYKVSEFVQTRLLGQPSNLSLVDFSEVIEQVTDVHTDEEDILKGIVKFGYIDVSEILRPRIDVVAVDYSNSLQQVLGVVVESGYSRIPVYVETFDNVKGILYVKDLLPHIDEKDGFRWQTLIRPPYFVPDTKKVKELLTEFQTSKNHVAVVVDEYGGTLGIVTLEDVLEEIVGEISDESDDDEKSYTQIDVNTYIFDGKTLLNDFHKILQTDSTVFDEVKGDADTLAGLILELKGAIPVKNEQLSYKKFTFKMEAVDSRRIKQIRVIINI